MAKGVYMLLYRHRLVLVRDEEPAPYGASIRAPSDVGKAARAMLADEAVEVVLAFFLDQAQRVRGYLELGRGGFAHVDGDRRPLFAAALLAGATAVILVHNHPSGRVEPSDEDRALCRSLRQAGEILAVEVLDFVIVGEEGITSALEGGWLR